MQLQVGDQPSTYTVLEMHLMQHYMSVLANLIVSLLPCRRQRVVGPEVSW